MVGNTYGMLLPTTSNTNNNSTSNINNGLSQLMEHRTQQANKVFENVTYKKMSGSSKSDFFDGGGLGKIGGDTQFKTFRIQSDAQGAE